MIPVAHTGKYGGPAELEKGLQQAFFIRTRAEKDAKAGEYTATVTAKNEKNEVILEKEIKAVVWNFTLPDTPATRRFLQIPNGRKKATSIPSTSPVIPRRMSATGK